MKRTVVLAFAAALGAAAAAPVGAASHLTLQGVATGHHPFALFDLDDSTYLLGVGDVIDGRTVRSIGTTSVRLSDGTVIRVSGAPVSSARDRAAAGVPEEHVSALRRTERPGDINISVSVPPPFDGGGYYGYNGYSGYDDALVAGPSRPNAYPPGAYTNGLYASGAFAYGTPYNPYQPPFFNGFRTYQAPFGNASGGVSAGVSSFPYGPPAFNVFPSQSGSSSGGRAQR